MPRIRHLCALFATLITLAVIAVPAASAHDQLLGTNPAADATLSAAPQSVQLSFNEAVLAMGSTIAVAGPTGPVAVGSPQANDRVLSVALPADLQAGRYEVTWRAVSADGHPVDGTFAFTLAGSTATSATSSSAAGTTPAPPATTAIAPTSGSEGSGTSLTIALVLAAAGVVLVAALLVILLRQRAKRP